MMRFGVRRLFAATTFVVTLVAGQQIGIQPVCLLAAACSVSLLVLVARSRDSRPIIRSLLLCFIGVVVGAMLSPGSSPPGEPGDEYLYMMCWSFFVWCAGTGIAHRDVLTPIEEPKDEEEPRDAPESSS